MAKMILGNTGTTVMPAVVVDKAPKYYVEKIVSNGALFSGAGTGDVIDLTGVTSIGFGALAYAYSTDTSVKNAPDFSNITSIGDYGCINMFVATSGDCYIEGEIDMGSVTTIGNYGCANMFNSNSKITKLDLHSLTSVGQYGCNRMLNTTMGRSQLTTIDLSELVTIGGYGCADMFVYSAITGAVDLHKVKTVSGNGCAAMFLDCDRITSVDLRDLQSFPGGTTGNCRWMFSRCDGLISVNLSTLREANTGYACESMFASCTALPTIDLSCLTTISGESACSQMFASCSSLASIDLSSLKSITGNSSCQKMFSSTALTELYLPALKTISGYWTVDNMLQGVTGCTVHLPSNFSTTPNFGGTNTTVVKDLPAAVILTDANSDKYERNPKYDTATALSWRANNSSVISATPYYTSGTTDPQVGDTIYSDASCTTAVTTISTIS